MALYFNYRRCDLLDVVPFMKFEFTFRTYLKSLIAALFIGIIFLIAFFQISIPIVEHYPSGAIKAKYNLRALSKEGTYQEFYEGGKIKNIQHYQRGHLNGLLEKFYPSGKLAWRVDLQNGVCCVPGRLG